MPHYNPTIHHRKSIRLKGYDYAQAGLYFITICVQNKACLLGKIMECQMLCNDIGQMVEKWYMELENKFPNIKCHEMVVMPNHFHCIIQNVGADLCVCPKNRECKNIEGEHAGSPLHIFTINQAVQWFKTMTTNEYIRNIKALDWEPFNGKFWQRNYYEHIIRNEQSHQRIADYIINNPAKWTEDKFYTE